MPEFTGQIVPNSVSFSARGKIRVTFELNEKLPALNMVDELGNCEKLDIKVAKWRDKRSMNANRYLWKLCELLADKLSEDGVPYTKEDIYRKAIKKVGIYREQGDLDPDFAKTIRHAWEMLGTGWVTEQVDYEQDGEKVVIRCYYGSSQYNTKQMSKVINWLVTECQQQGIETKSQEEINSLLERWQAG